MAGGVQKLFAVCACVHAFSALCEASEHCFSIEYFVIDIHIFCVCVCVCVCVIQARHVEGGSAGLIPSQMLEEKRKAFVKRDVELTPAGNCKEEIMRTKKRC